MYKLSIIIPVYNEEGTVEEIVRRVEAAPMPPNWEKEIIIADDASTDGTRDVVRRLESRVRVLYCEQNGGKGTAVFEGLKAATGTHMITQDADLEYDPNEIQLLLEQISAGKADAVYGSRTLKHREYLDSLKPEDRRGARVARRGVWVLTKLINMLWGLHLTDACAGYKLFPAAAAPLWRKGGFESDIRLAGALARHGFTITEVPVSYHPRGFSEGKKIRYKDGIIAIMVLLKDRILL